MFFPNYMQLESFPLRKKAEVHGSGKIALECEHMGFKIKYVRVSITSSL